MLNYLLESAIPSFFLVLKLPRLVSDFCISISLVLFLGSRALKPPPATIVQRYRFDYIGLLIPEDGLQVLRSECSEKTKPASDFFC